MALRPCDGIAEDDYLVVMATMFSDKSEKSGDDTAQRTHCPRRKHIAYNANANVARCDHQSHVLS
jgi:hypothetical protein